MRTNDVYSSLQCLINAGCSQNALPCTSTPTQTYCTLRRHMSAPPPGSTNTNTRADALLCSVMMALSGGHYPWTGFDGASHAAVSWCQRQPGVQWRFSRRPPPTPWLIPLNHSLFSSPANADTIITLHWLCPSHGPIHCRLQEFTCN